MQALLRTKRWQQGSAGRAWAAHLILRPQYLSPVEVARPVIDAASDSHLALNTEERRAISSHTSVAKKNILDRILQDERLEKWAAVTKSLQACLQHVGPWSLGDLAFGLKAVAEQHIDEGVEDTVEGDEITDRVFVERLLDEVWIAEAVHQNSADKMAALCCLERRHILVFDGEADHFKTAFALAVWPSRKQVVLVVRGTTSLADALTDLTGHLEAFDGTTVSAFLGGPAKDDVSAKARAEVEREGGDRGYCHHGIAKAAMALLEAQGDVVARVLREHPGYTLKLMGHSLGAGTAALAAMLIHNSPELGERLGARGVSCVAFATPPVVTRALAVEACGYIQSVVYHHDVVPRASLAGFEGLRQEMLATQWEQRLQTELKSNRAVELALKARKGLDETLSDVGIAASGERASRAIASAWAGARAAISSKLGATLPEAASVGAAVGSSVESARTAAEDARGGSSAGSRGGGSGGGADGGGDGGSSGAVGRQAHIPHLYAPGELLYLRSASGGKDAPAKYCLVRANPQEQRFHRIVLSPDMVNHHRATSYIEAIEGVARQLGVEVLPHPS